jgi:hypothetical protein
MPRLSPHHLRVSDRKPTRARVSPKLVLGVLGLVVLLGAVGLPLQRATALRQGEAVWSVKCNHTHSAPDDPIVFPAQAGQSHLHDFFGNISVDANTTTDSLGKAASSCDKGMDEVDRAAYWTPALLHNGQPVTGPPDELRIDGYYSVSDKPLPVRPMPFGLRMIAGDSKAQSPQSTDVVHYNCLRYPQGGQVTGSSATIPTCPGGSYLSAKIVFPGCWDGSNLDSADHKSHLAYPVKGDCPVSHPVRLPTLAIRLRWKTARSLPSSQLALSSGGQLSMHADFWNAWSPSVMQWLVDNCLNATKNCTDIARSQIAAATGSFPSGGGAQAPSAPSPSVGAQAASSVGPQAVTRPATPAPKSAAPTAGKEQPNADEACPRESFRTRRAWRQCKRALEQTNGSG